MAQENKHSLSVSLPLKHTPIFMLILQPDTHKIPREENLQQETMHQRTTSHRQQAVPGLPADFETVSEEIKAPLRIFS